MPGSISGKLYDAWGRRIKDVPGDPEDAVRATGPVPRSVYPNYNAGEYLILDLPAGTYRLEADLVGFSIGVPTTVVVQDGLVTEHDFNLQYAGSVQGTVCDLDTSDPIADAEVVAVAQSWPVQGVGYGAASTPSGGAYQVENLNAGVWPEPDFALYDVLAWAEGYSAVLQTDVGVHPQTPTALDFLLPAAASIAITVTDELGSPIAGALVYALQTDGIGAGSSVWVETDSSGDAVLANLQAPGTHQVTALVDVARLPVRKSFTLAPGDVTTDTFMLAWGPRITGLVRDYRTGLPITDSVVYTWGPGGAASEFQTDTGTDPEGRYRIYGAQPGVYYLKITALGYLPAVRQVSLITGEVEVPAVDAIPEGEHGAYPLTLM